MKILSTIGSKCQALNVHAAKACRENAPMSRRERLLIYPLLGVLSVLFLLCFALWESPLYPDWYGCDASFFSMAGRGILAGWVPYVDFFDLKGPYFFFLEALGQLIHKDRLGIFLLEIPFLWASLILITEICRLFVSRIKTAAIVIIVLFLHVATLWGGNTLEEYMLPLNLAVLYLTLRNALRDPDGENGSYKDDQREGAGTACALDLGSLPAHVPLLTGICFGIIAFSKITVAAPLSGVVIAVALNLAIDRHWKALLKYLGLCLLGLAVAVCPIFLYFGYHHAIPRMLYCVFEFAMKRSVDYSETFNKDWELKTIGAIFAFFFAVSHFRKLRRAMAILVISLSVMTYVLLHLGVPFIYYFTPVVPVLVLAMALLLKLYDPLILFSGIRQFVCLAMIGVMLYFYAHPALETIDTFLCRGDNPWYGEDVQAARDLASLIPRSERNNVFSFSIDMTWFEANQMLPCNPYQVNLQFFIALDPTIEDELVTCLNETPPKWLVVRDSFGDEIPSLFAIVDQKYDCICSNSSGNLYLLKE